MLLRTAGTKSGENTPSGEEAGKLGALPRSQGECRTVQPLCKIRGQFLLNLLVELLEDPAITLSGIYPRKWKFMFTQKFGQECSYQLYLS